MVLISDKEMSLEEQIQKSAKIYARYNSRANNTAYYAYIEGAQSMLPKIEELEKRLAEMTCLKNSFAGGVDILDRDNKELQEERKNTRTIMNSIESLLEEALSTIRDNK